MPLTSPLLVGPEPSRRDDQALPDVFRRLFEAEFSYVCRTLRRLGVRQADLEDTAQEVFVSVHRRFEEYDARLSARSWLFSFALRVAANYRRRPHYRREVPGEHDAVHSREPSPEAHTLEAETRQIVLRALDKLDFDRRAVFVMHDIDGFSAPDIAVELSIPVNTVYSRLRTARQEFQAHAARMQGGSR